MQHPNTLDHRVLRRRARWRRLNRSFSAGVGLIAVAAGVYIGVTGPATSPVQPAAVAAAPTTAPSAPATPDTSAGAAGGAAAAAPQPARRGGGDRGGDRFRMTGSDRHRR